MIYIYSTTIEYDLQQMIHHKNYVHGPRFVIFGCG